MLVLCLLSILSSLSAQNIPELGSASDALWSKSDELSVGKAAYNHLLQQGNIYESAADLDYLSYLGNKIASYASTRLGLRFYLTRSTSINAFATPGGYVGVNVGLVLATENEHELAGVLAHEIAHVSREHIARTLLAAKNRQFANTAALIAGVLMASQGSGELGVGAISAVLAGETQNQINDIRRHEIEADREGQRLMQAAGFNPLGMQSFFGKLYTPSALKNAPAYLLTHPLPERRQAALDSLKKRAKKLNSRDEYYLFRARVCSAFLAKPALAQIIAKDLQSNKAAVRDSAKYLSALQAMKSGKIQAALSDIAKMKTPMGNNRDVQLLRATLYLLSQQNDKARAIYRRLWKKYTGDNVVAYDYARFLSQRGDLRAAEKLLEKQLGHNNPQLYWLYGQILGRLGKTTKQHSMLIRFYQQNGQYEKALAQAQIAAALPNLDWQSRAGFEAQQKSLKRLISQAEAN